MSNQYILGRDEPGEEVDDHVIKKRVAAALAGTMVWTMVFSASPAWGKELAAQEYAEQEARIHEVLQKIVEQHVNSKLDIRKLTDGAIRGIVEETGDPYTAYFTEDEFSDFIGEVEGQFSGIGIYIEQRGQAFFVESVLEDSPASEAGLRSGDEIVVINGQKIAGKSVGEVTDEMKGQPGTQIEIQVRRQNQLINKIIKREDIQVSPVDSIMLDDKIGYMALYTFSYNIADVFSEQVTRLKNDGMKGLIIDLRDNPGGHIEGAIDIADLFIPKGTLVNMVDRSGKKLSVPATGKGSAFPIVVLVNGNTASASEILSGALQDHHAAWIIGTKTFGKGTVQEITPLEKGGVLKMTVEEYFSPNMHKINGKGITPDEVVQNSNEQIVKAITYLKGSTSLHLFADGNVSFSGFPPAASHFVKKVNGRWYVALRPFAQVYGYRINWNGTKQQVALRIGETERKYTVRNNPHVRNENGAVWVALDQLDQDFASISLEKQGGDLLVHIK